MLAVRMRRPDNQRWMDPPDWLSGMLDQKQKEQSYKVGVARVRCLCCMHVQWHAQMLTTLVCVCVCVPQEYTETPVTVLARIQLQFVPGGV